ncbi:MAG: transporter, partial [Planctomycetota bacterium]
REMARVRGAQERLKQHMAFLEDQERFQISQLSDAINKVAVHYGQLQDSANEWQSTEREVQVRLAEFEQGTSEVNVVLQSQQRRADAQIGYYRALTEYNKSLNYVDYLRGTLLANSNIVLREGPWNSKAYCDALERARERAAGYHLQYGVTRPGVVRKGPVQNTNSTATSQPTGMRNIGDVSSGQSITPNTIMDSGTVIDGGPGDMMLNDPALGETILSDPMGLNMPMSREVPEISDQPLQQLNDQLLKPAPAADPSTGTATGTATGSIQPMSYQDDVIGSGLDRAPAGKAPVPVRRKPIAIRSGVSPDY